jgi:hypothetical protein
MMQSSCFIQKFSYNSWSFRTNTVSICRWKALAEEESKRLLDCISSSSEGWTRIRNENDNELGLFLDKYSLDRPKSIINYVPNRKQTEGSPISMFRGGGIMKAPIKVLFASSSFTQSTSCSHSVFSLLTKLMNSLFFSSSTLTSNVAFCGKTQHKISP